MMLPWLRRLIGRALRGSPVGGRPTRPWPEGGNGAADLAGEKGDALPGGDLLGRLADTDTAVREAAKQALRSRGNAALPVLLVGLDHAQVLIASVAAELLGELRREEAVGALLKALKYGKRPVQLAARRALGRCGGVAVPPLRAALSESNPWVHRQIREALADAESGGSPVSEEDVRPPQA